MGTGRISGSNDSSGDPQAPVDQAWEMALGALALALLEGRRLPDPGGADAGLALGGARSLDVAGADHPRGISRGLTGLDMAVPPLRRAGHGARVASGASGDASTPPLPLERLCVGALGAGGILIFCFVNFARNVRGTS